MFGIKGAWRDIDNYREWIQVIKNEEANPKSTYNKFGISHNFSYMIYLVLKLDDQHKDLSDNIKETLVIEQLAPVNRYLDEELNWAEYLDRKSVV